MSNSDTSQKRSREFRLHDGVIGANHAIRLIRVGCSSEPTGCTHVQVRDLTFSPWRTATETDLPDVGPAS